MNQNLEQSSNKYYTPTIEEFHVGFEYELKDMDEWKVQVHGSLESKDALTRFNAHVRNLDYLEYLSATIHNNPHNIRIKYLDSSDIESLGFEYGEYSKKRVNGETIELHKCGSSYEGADQYSIYAVGEYSRDLLFLGTIKNKSELKKLLKQLNIN